MKLINQIRGFCGGKKSYVIGGLMILLGIFQENNQLILEGIALITLRAGVAKLAK